MIIGLLVLLGLVGLVLLYAMFRPNDFVVQRSVKIKSPPEIIFSKVNNLGQWPAWSPYEKLDPAMKITLSGPASGVGAVHEWDGNSKAGAGRMEIIQSTPSSAIKMKLDMLRPMKNTNTVTFTFLPEAELTTVTWAMTGKSLYIAKVMGIFINMDNLVGKDFAVGLQNLKALMEKGN